MKKHRLTPYTLFSLFIVATLIIVSVSFVYIDRLVHQLQEEETRKVHLWAEATEQLIRAEEGADLNLILSIIEGNTTIPVYMLDAKGQVVDSRNVGHPADDPTKLNGPIELRVEDSGVAYMYYIYYDESTLLTRLRVFPYMEFGIILLLVVVAIMSLYTVQKAEQNSVWVGLSKETAHQLGTPISSLMAWQELLEARYPHDEHIPELRQDVNRLKMIAERFSKIGSEPELKESDMCAALERVIQYMRTRISDKVVVNLSVPTTPCLVRMSEPLFAWVVENLMKNAVDAMEGRGEIHLLLQRVNHRLVLDITDTGKGIERSRFRTVFRPGYTSKQRGWGLGLSLSKRIIEDYHGGHLFILQSEIGRGTTFRITMEDAIDS